jgi:hypothetical protein
LEMRPLEHWLRRAQRLGLLPMERPGKRPWEQQIELRPMAPME